MGRLASNSFFPKSCMAQHTISLSLSVTIRTFVYRRRFNAFTQAIVPNDFSTILGLVVIVHHTQIFTSNDFCNYNFFHERIPNWSIWFSEQSYIKSLILQSNFYFIFLSHVLIFSLLHTQVIEHFVRGSIVYTTSLANDSTAQENMLLFECGKKLLNQN